MLNPRATQALLQIQQALQVLAAEAPGLMPSWVFKKKKIKSEERVRDSLSCPLLWKHVCLCLPVFKNLSWLFTMKSGDNPASKLQCVRLCSLQPTRKCSRGCHGDWAAAAICATNASFPGWNQFGGASALCHPCLLILNYICLNYNSILHYFILSSFYFKGN